MNRTTKIVPAWLVGAALVGVLTGCGGDPVSKVDVAAAEPTRPTVTATPTPTATTAAPVPVVTALPNKPVIDKELGADTDAALALFTSYVERLFNNATVLAGGQSDSALMGILCGDTTKQVCGAITHGVNVDPGVLDAYFLRPEPEFKPAKVNGVFTTRFRIENLKAVTTPTGDLKITGTAASTVHALHEVENDKGDVVTSTVRDVDVTRLYTLYMLPTGDGWVITTDPGATKPTSVLAGE
jgi:hypothetical protein